MAAVSYHHWTTSKACLVPYLLFFAFVVVPLAEIFVIIQVGEIIGPWWTVALLVFDSLVGAWLVKREGVRAWRNVTSSFDGLRSPVDDLTQGALIVFGGALLLTPGFITDVLGLACVLPFTRAPMSRLVRRVAAATAARRMGAGKAGATTVFFTTSGTSSSDTTRRRPVRPSSATTGADAGSTSGRSGADHADPDTTRDVPDVEVLGIERDDDPTQPNGAGG